MDNMDFVAVGDTVIDDFIRLKEAMVHCDNKDANCTICMRFGDKIPFESSTVVYGVGNAANAAVSAARLGLKTGFVSNVGDDDRGARTLLHFKEENVDATYIEINKGMPTNYHYVLWFGAERTILIKHQKYAYSFPQNLPPPKTFYLSSLAEGTEEYHDEIATYLEAHPSIFFAFQPGTFQMTMGTQRLSRIYARADFFVCNKDEAARVLKIPFSSDVEMLAKEINALGPKIVIITDGPNGIDAYQDGQLVHVPMFPDPQPPLQRTGAGDALASTTAAYLSMGMTLEESLLRGTVNAAYVVQKIGAQAGLLKKGELEKILKESQST